MPYKACFGRRTNVAVTCRGCKRTIMDKNELRIRVDGIFTPNLSGPYPGANSFCLNIHCVRRALQRDKEQEFFPYFDGQVGITAEIKSTLGNVLPSVEGIQWITV